MKLKALKKEIQKFQYFEDTSVVDVSLASLIATQHNVGDPIWLIIIGASSGGKSQILRPLSLTNPKTIHRVDDLTENTFLSAKAGDEKNSLLHRIGKRGIIAISDLTVLFSKNSEARNAILAQFRMIYDGEMTKQSGNSTEGNTWKGKIGVISGSTPSIYAKFEEVADMGERFIYYRMKEYDPQKATEIALNRTMFGSDLDDHLAEVYREYMMDVRNTLEEKDVELELSKEVKKRIIEVAMLAERIRTTAKKDWKGEVITNIPVPAMPMRVALQLSNIAKGLMAISLHESGKTDLNDEMLHILDWCAFSLANEEKRSCLMAIAKYEFGVQVKTAMVADEVGLDTNVVKNVLQNLSAVGILKRDADINGSSLMWSFAEESDWKVLRRIAEIKESVEFKDREMTMEDEIEETEDDEDF